MNRLIDFSVKRANSLIIGVILLGATIIFVTWPKGQGTSGEMAVTNEVAQVESFVGQPVEASAQTTTPPADSAKVYRDPILTNLGFGTEGGHKVSIEYRDTKTGSTNNKAQNRYR